MFAIEKAKNRSGCKRVDNSFVAVIDRELKAYTEDMTKALSMTSALRSIESGPRRPRQMIQRLCHESMFARLHNWKITRHPAHRCWNCGGTLLSYEEGQGIYDCDICTGGWIPEQWSYRCRRCNHYQSKG